MAGEMTVVDQCLEGVDLSEFGFMYRGKVRDSCTTDDGRYILVVTDRISAFDHVLKEQIPFKGQVLNQLAAYFFERTGDIIPNHVLSVPDPNVTIAKKCTVFPIEFVVRGYLVGHAWREYRSGKRTLCGNPMPDGMRENERFAKPLLTPTTKAHEGHDEDISREEILERGLIDRVTLDRLESYAMALFARGSQMAQERGLILVDTKYEFGTDEDGEIVLLDEVHTPDSSRYFYADTYDELLSADQPQRQLSKEFVREWLMDRDFRGLEGQTMPSMPDEFRIKVSSRYIELFQAMTGRDFEPAVSDDPEERVLEAIRSAL
jgi:phosphoribosylaminoimidazole-succinocarboxamide synthase